MALGSVMTKADFDAQTDDPKLAFTELAANVDIYNALQALLFAAAGLGVTGDGVKDDGAGNLAVALATDAGLEFATKLLKVKLQTDSGLERVAAGLKVDINGLTTATPDTAADFLMWWDATDSTLKKALMDDVAPGVGAGSITQTEIAAAAVGQGELKTSTGDMTLADLGSSPSSAFVTGPGGEYGFWPTIKNSFNRSDTFAVGPIVDSSVITLGTSFLQRFHLYSQTSSNDTLTVRQRYVTASPPFDFGDGPALGFIFALILNATGEPFSMYQADVPPWAYNGPTDIRPQLVDKNGKKFRLVEQGRERMSDILADRGKETALLNSSAGRVKGKLIPQEITNAVKNADMALIPHPFMGNDMTGKTVVMLDPMSGFMERIMEFQQDGDAPLEEIFAKGFAKIDNVKLPRGGPPGVDVVAAKLK